MAYGLPIEELHSINTFSLVFVGYLHALLHHCNVMDSNNCSVWLRCFLVASHQKRIDDQQASTALDCRGAAIILTRCSGTETYLNTCRVCSAGCVNSSLHLIYIIRSDVSHLNIIIQILNEVQVISYWYLWHGRHGQEWSALKFIGSVNVGTLDFIKHNWTMTELCKWSLTGKLSPSLK